MGARAAAMRPSGLYAKYRGVPHRVRNGGTLPDGREYVNLVVEDDGERTERVPVADLDTYERVVTTGRYDGQEVWLEGSGDRVACRFLGSPEWAARHGFTGSQHDGWVGEVDADEITDIRERVTDLLASR